MNTVLEGSAVPCTEGLRTVVIDPLRYSSWDSEIRRHPQSSFFHRSCWAQILKETYGHQPVYFCGIRDNRIEQALPVIEVSSPLTGRRGVSLPFSDFCTVLKSGEDHSGHLYDAALQYGRNRKWKYLECRDQSRDWSEAKSGGLRPGPKDVDHLRFFVHHVDLGGSEESRFKSLDGSMRRAVRKAEKAGVSADFQDSPDAMRTFYKLHCQTRKRHGLPPQPLKFFENIWKHAIQSDSGKVGIARIERQPIAASVFLEHNNKALYKFGASDFGFQHLRPSNLLMWEAIKHYANRGFASLHLGRGSISNDGLRRFKLGFGAIEAFIEHRKYNFRQDGFVTDADRTGTSLKKVFRLLPQPLFRFAGTLLYPHLS